MANIIDKLKDIFTDAGKVATQKSNGSYKQNTQNTTKVVNNKSNDDMDFFTKYFTNEGIATLPDDSKWKQLNNGLEKNGAKISLNTNNIGTGLDYKDATNAYKEIGSTVKKGVDKVNDELTMTIKVLADGMHAINKSKRTLGKTEEEIAAQKDPVQVIGETISKGANKVSNFFVDNDFSKSINTDAIMEKAKLDPTYVSKIISDDGQMVDYTSNIEQLKEGIKNTGNPYDRKALQESLKEIEEIQADQKKLLYASYYDQLIDKGATEDELNEFKNYVIAQDDGGIAKVMGTVGGSLENWVGSMVNAGEALYQKVAFVLGSDYDSNDPNSVGNMLIDNAEQHLANASQGVEGVGKVVQDVYNGTSGFLLSMIAAYATGGGSEALSTEAGAKAIMEKSLLMSDVSVFGQNIKAKQEQGYDFETAFTNSSYHAVLNHLTESIGGETLVNIVTKPLGKLSTKYVLAYGAKSLMESFGAEAIEEGYEALAEPIIDSLTLDTGLTLDEYMNQVFSKDTAYQMLIGGLGGLASGTVAGIANIAKTKKGINQLESYKATLNDYLKTDETLTNEQKVNIIKEMRIIDEAVADSERDPWLKAVTTEDDVKVANMTAQEVEDITKKAAQYDISEDMKEIVELKDKTLEKGVELSRNIEETNAAIEEQNKATNELKEKQLEIVKESNPMDKDLGSHTWINELGDINTFEEVNKEIEDVTPDYTADMVQEALNTGKITVYSSHPIENGTFVTPSRMEAQNYAGDGNVYSKEVNTSDVAWIDQFEGQYANANEEITTAKPKTEYRFSPEVTQQERTLKSYLKEKLNVNTRRNSIQLNTLLNKATQDIIDTGTIQEETYRELYDVAYENTKVKNEAPDYDPSEIRKYLKSNDINFEGLVKDLPKGAREKLYFRNKNSGAFRFSNDVNASGWDQVMQEFNQRYAGLINPEEINSGVDFVNEVQDALAMLDEQKNGYRVPDIENGMSESDYEAYFREKLDDALKLYSEDIAKVSSEDYINQKLAEEYGQANMNQLLQEEQDAINAYYDQASVGNLSQEELDQFERDSIETLTPEQAREKGATVLTDPVIRNKPLRTMKETLYQVRQKIFDKGIAIRDLKNSKLNASYDYYLNSENMANNLILNGRTIGDNKVVKSLNEISKQIPKDQKNAFDEYMYHRLNIDAAKLRKNVWFGVEAVQSEQIVNQYDLAHPDWKNVAQDYYDYNNYLLSKQVESGVISPDTAAKWKEMYPNYVPIIREASPVDESSVIETKDPKVQSSNKGTLNERTGGNSSPQPLDYAMAEHTKKVFRSTTFNNVARDYVQASNSKTTTFMEMYEPDEVVNGNVETLQAADKNTPATLIWYDGGDRKIVEIPENIYDAFAPTVTPFKAGDSKILTTINKLRTNMITGANPVFWVTNGVKDAQDIAFNSKYAKDTYMNLPRAFKEIVTHGDIYQSYVANGGEYNTYSSEAGLDQNEHGKFYNATIGNFVKWNNAIEMTPRLAEYMSSLDHGDSVETAMYNAAEVTTNFKRGGDYAKWLNRNGATFLNASIQGFDKQVRNITDAYDSKGWKGIASYMAKATLLSGIPLVAINGLLHKDDKDYEKLSDYIKDDYYVLFKYDDGKFFRIPKGRIVNAWQGTLTSIYENGKELVGDDELTKKAQTIWENTLDSLLNVWEQVGINNPKENNLLAPVFQVANNESWYGEPIVSSFMEKKDAADQYDESTDLVSIWLGEKLNLSPKKINYLLDQYSGGAGDVVLPMLTQKAETGIDNGTVGGKVASAIVSPFADKFTTDSVFKNQDVSDFFTLQDELTAQASKDNATDDVKLSSKYINAIQYRMNELYAQKRDIYNSSMSDVEKYEAAREVQREIDDLAETGINTYDQVDIQDDYGFVNGYTYHRNNENSWSKIDDSTLEVMDDLNMTPSQRNEFFNIKDTIKEFKGDTKKAQSYDTIVNSNLSDEQKNYMYDKYYDSKVGDYINTLDISDKDKLDLKYNVSSMTGIKDSNGKSIANSKALAVANEYAKAGVLDEVMNYIQENDLEPSSMGLSKTVYNYTYDQIASAYQNMYGQEFGVRQDGQVGNNDTAAIDKVSTGTTKGSTKSSTKTTSKKTSTSKTGLKLTGNRQLDEKKIIAYIGSLMSGTQSNPYKGVSTVLNKTKSGTNMLSDVKKNVDAIKKKYM